ncbi:unnamed protein product [Caenorhabditis auriculariae]|uniref:Uncharacterized protein n=1 Tax=Caenorhabditis auriculariae TaxID=2777116 RepID=A0A8S1H8P8_9PELO|nr:unnamed protein product [Caenorhabditis auriculariae]
MGETTQYCGLYRSESNAIPRGSRERYRSPLAATSQTKRYGSESLTRSQREALAISRAARCDIGNYLVYHHTDGDNFTTLTSDIAGCSGDYCSTDVLNAIATKLKPPQPMDQWCNVDPRSKASTSNFNFLGLLLSFAYVFSRAFLL